MTAAKVLIVMGSGSDRPIMEEASKILDEFDVLYRVVIASAHRTPEKAMKLAKEAADEGTQILIAGAGFAAHLAGSMAANTVLPVIGVPLDTSSLSGLDALLSTVQMPVGLPVATMSIGKTGAKNAGIFAVEILALSDKKLFKKLLNFRKGLSKKIEEENKKI